MRNPITKLRMKQFDKLLSKLIKFQKPQNEDEETLLIKNFEIAFELAVNTLTLLYLSQKSDPSPLKKKIIIWAFQFKIIDDPEMWVEYMKLRNQTVHEYLADEIYEHLTLVKKFISSFKFFIQSLERIYEQQES